MRFLSTRIVTVVIVALMAATASGQTSKTAPSLLEAARQKATIEGDQRGAILIYKDVVTRFSRSDRPSAATALLRMAECYEKLGDPLASETYRRILAEYSDQAVPAAAARSRLSSGMPKIICEECGDPIGSISPDGRLMVTVSPYLGPGERSGDVGLLDLNNRKLTPLQVEGSGKAAAGTSLAPVFSPDGRSIVYSWAANASFGLRIVPRETAGKMRTLPSPGTHEIILPLSWASSGILAIAQKTDGALDLVMVSPADGTQRTIKSLRFNMSPAPHVASLSSDGRFVAYEQFTTEQTSFVNGPRGVTLDRQIHVLATDGSSDVPITTGAGIKRWATWTPNGSHVMYISNVAGAWDLWATPIRAGKPSGAPVLVKKNIGEVQTVGVSAAGLFHFYEGRSGVFKTTVVPVGSATPQTASETFIGERPAWSPDGTKVSISRPQPGGLSGVDVVVRTIATGSERVYRREGILSFPFMWYPDGSGLLVQVREAPNSQFWYRLDLASGEFRRLVQQRGNPAFWTHQNIRTLSADGSTLYFGTYANQTDSQLDRITALNLSTGEYRDVVRLPGSKDSLPAAAQDLALAASPDGRSLVIFSRDPKASLATLAVVGVDGQGYRALTTPFKAENLRNKLVWSRDGRWIYFTSRFGDADVHRVMRIAATGGTPETTGLDVDGLEAFDVSPDGSRLAHSTLRPEGWGMLLWSLDVSWLMKPGR